MTYDAVEASTAEGRPYYLYQFIEGDAVWRFTSRASFEMVQKTLKAGAGALTAVSAPTRLAVQIAQAHQLALAGLVRGDSFTAYAGADRFSNTSFPLQPEMQTHGYP